MERCEQFKQGELAYRNGESYKANSSAAWINGWTKEERLSSCGFSNYHWNRSGVVASSQYGGKDNFIHTRQNTVRNGD